MASQETILPPTLPYLDSSGSSLNSTGNNQSTLETLTNAGREVSQGGISDNTLSTDSEGLLIHQINEFEVGRPINDTVTADIQETDRTTSATRKQRSSNSSGPDVWQDHATYKSLFNTAGVITFQKQAPESAEISTRDDLTLAKNYYNEALGVKIQGPRSDLSTFPLYLVIRNLDIDSVQQARQVCKRWKSICDDYRPPRFPAVYELPIEILQNIMSFMTPTSFNSARHTCRAWYVSSLSAALLRRHFGTMGFCETDPFVRLSQNPLLLSQRYGRECSLGSDGSGRNNLQNTAILDMSDVGSAGVINFTVSTCGTHVLICEGCIVYVYRFQPGTSSLLEFVTSIVCPRRSLAVSMDTSSRRYSVAILMEGRMGLVHDLVEQESKSIYKNICSEDDCPRSVAICPQRRCVAFGCQGGIELHWVDALTGQDLNRWFPLTAPSDFLYFLPPRRGIDSAKKLRLISSAAHPEETNQLTRRFGIGSGRVAYWEAWEPRVGYSDHFQAIPLSDGYHIIFTDPATGALCLGSDAPLGGPTKLLRKIWLVPPEFGMSDKATAEELDLDSWIRAARDSKSKTRPNIYTSGSELRYGVRIVAGYGDHVILYSVPPDIFNNAKSDDEDDSLNLHPAEARHTANGTNIPVKILGSSVGDCPGLTDLAVDSGPAMTIYAFSASGLIRTYQLEGTVDGRRIERKYNREGMVVHAPEDVDGSISVDEFGESFWKPFDFDGREFVDDWDEWKSGSEGVECEVIH